MHDKPKPKFTKKNERYSKITDRTMYIGMSTCARDHTYMYDDRGGQLHVICGPRPPLDDGAMLVR